MNPPPIPGSERPKRFGCLPQIILLLLVLSVIVNLLLFAVVGKGAASKVMAGSAAVRLNETVVDNGEGGEGKIALIELSGVISFGGGDGQQGMVEELKTFLRHAAKDDEVKAIILAIDSPGGEVTASDTIYEAVRQAREAKPVVVFMKSVAASGGYYAACGASWLMASETTITGSIGVIWQTLKYKELFGKIGLEAMTFKSGKFKDLLNGSRDVTQEEIDYVQALVMQTYDKFLNVVATERGLDADKLRNTVADGRILSGKDALSAGLLNSLGYIENAYEKARELGKAEGAPVVRYEAPFNFAKAFRLFGQAKNEQSIKIDTGLLPKLRPGALYLLPDYYAE